MLAAYEVQWPCLDETPDKPGSRGCHDAGRVEDILQTYDRERRVLPPPVRMWEWGWTKSAETWNGRIASMRICSAPVTSCQQFCFCDFLPAALGN